MGRRYEYNEWKDVNLTIDGIAVEARVHVEGWYSSGDGWGYGTEPPDGDDEITDIEIDCAYDETTCEDVPITDSLKAKVRKEVERGTYW